VFVNSISDLFHEQVPLHYIRRVFEVMADCPQHRFQVLTKRADRLVERAPELPWPRNVWMGVSVETAEYTWRIHDLRRVPAAVRFLSLEPLLGPLGNLPLKGIHWVIVGGESGRRPRPMDPAWVVRSSVSACAPRSRSSSSSGAERTRRRPGESSTAGNGISSQRRHPSLSIREA